MTDIHITAEDTAGMLRQVREVIGGRIRERWGEFVLEVSGAHANGSIRLVTFDWGVSLLIFQITFYEEVKLILDTPNHNPLHFVYCLEGYCRHKFDNEPKDQIKTMEQYQSVILTNKDSGLSYWYFPKEVPLEINVIQIIRRKFLKKRLNGVEQLNERLYEVFHDLDHENTYSHYGSYDLRMADKVSSLINLKTRGMMRVIKIEGVVYQLLSQQISDHEKFASRRKNPTNLLKRDLKTIRQLAGEIIKNPGKNFRLDELARKTGNIQGKIRDQPE
ncbi:MAG: AraC family transcriptional regulator [Robiginitalea sp.]